MIHTSIYRNQFSTPEMRALFANENLIQKWIDVEAALAEVQADLGMIPAQAAVEIRAKADVHQFDIPKIELGIADTWHPLISFVRQYTDLCSDGHGQFIHWGVTTQDVMDTGLVLQIREAIRVVEGNLDGIINGLCEMALLHKSTIMAGRTHGQHALPTTFGYKLAVWIGELDRHRERLAFIQRTVFVGTITGAVGTLASMGGQGLRVQELVLKKLDLVAPDSSWHVARDRIADVLGFLGQLGGTFGKIANEIIQLQKTEIAEVEEPFQHGKVGSSTMPQKRNPMACEAVAAVALMLRNQAGLSHDLMVQEHERDMAVWQAEWAVVPEAFLLTSGMLHHMSWILRGLHIRPDAMRRNLDASKGLILAEAVMMALAPSLGRQVAHDVVYDAAMKSYESEVPFADVIGRDERMAHRFRAEEIRELLRPERYIGQAVAFTERVVKKARR